MVLEVLKKIDDTFKLNTIRARKITTIVYNEFPKSIYIRRDIYNARARLHRCNLEGYTPISALIKLFNDNDIKYIKKIDPEDPERLLSLIFTFLTYIEIAKIFPKVYIPPLPTLPRLPSYSLPSLRL